METEKRLIEEIEKWTKKIRKELENMESASGKGDGFLKNINAYVSDSDHFLKKSDLIRSFEAIVWAWAWLEIGKELCFLKKEYISIGKDTGK
jgi:hypothetical protein